MYIFENMLLPDVRLQFCNKKQKSLAISTEDFQDMKNYILSKSCEDDIIRLMQGDYFISIPTRFKIRKSNSMRRRICYKFVQRDKFLLKLMAYVLVEYDNIYTTSLYSFRKCKNHNDFFKVLKDVDFKRSLYVFKTDIHNYGASIDQDILLMQLKKLFKDDPDFYNFISWLMTRNLFYEKGELHHERVSIIPGMPIGSFFNNVYLNELDKYMEANCKLYMRYTDDIAIFVDSLEEIENLKQYAFKKILSLNLTINEEKTLIYKPGESFDLLGIKILPNAYDIADHSLGKIKFKMYKKAKNLAKLCHRKKIATDESLAQMMNFVNNYFFGQFCNIKDLNWAAHAFNTITRDDTLREIDHYVQNCLRIAGTGKFSGARYRLTYKAMKKKGYKSLVNAYHHGYTIV